MIICDYCGYSHYLLLFMIIYGDLFLLSYVSVVCINEGPSELFFAKRFKNQYYWFKNYK